MERRSLNLKLGPSPAQCDGSALDKVKSVPEHTQSVPFVGQKQKRSPCLAWSMAERTARLILGSSFRDGPIHEAN